MTKHCHDPWFKAPFAGDWLRSCYLLGATGGATNRVSQPHDHPRFFGVRSALFDHFRVVWHCLTMPLPLLWLVPRVGLEIRTKYWNILKHNTHPLMNPLKSGCLIARVWSNFCVYKKRLTPDLVAFEVPALRSASLAWRKMRRNGEGLHGIDEFAA